jgi:O-succinylhomoserine sulfhydrylase
LALRVDKHCQNALKIAEYLEKHPKIKSIKYPFLDAHPQKHIAIAQMKAGGNIIAFEVGKTGADAIQFMDNTRMLSITANLGDSRSIITHPASSTHSKLSEEERLHVGISSQMIRMSVGLEHVEDIIEDLAHGLR